MSTDSYLRGRRTDPETVRRRARAALARGELLHSPAVCALTGITFRQLTYWVSTELLRPARAARGSGTQTGYDATDVRTIGVVKELLDLGVSLQRVRTALPMVREAETDGLRWLVVTPGDTVGVAAGDPVALERVIGEARAAVVLDLGGPSP